MKTALIFDDKDTKALLTKFDFEFYINRVLKDASYSEQQIQSIYASYSTKLEKLKTDLKANKKQTRLYIEGQIRRMFNGGFLPNLFCLDQSIKTDFLHFEGVGEGWAYFELWKKSYKHKLRLQKIWNTTIKVGSILAIALSLIKIWETFFKS